MKKLIIFGVAAVIALASLSVGYALWQKTLTISGTVTTGDIAVLLSTSGASDDEITGKDVSGIECVAANSPTGSSVTVTVDNAYPSITYTCNVTVTGAGSVPVHFTDWVFSPALPACFDVKEFPVFAGQQIHDGDTFTDNITLHMDNDCTQTTIYPFTATAIYHQYNENP